MKNSNKRIRIVFANGGYIDSLKTKKIDDILNFNNLIKNENILISFLGSNYEKIIKDNDKLEQYGFKIDKEMFINICIKGLKKWKKKNKSSLTLEESISNLIRCIEKKLIDADSISRKIKRFEGYLEYSTKQNLLIHNNLEVIDKIIKFSNEYTKLIAIKIFARYIGILFLKKIILGVFNNDGSYKEHEIDEAKLKELKNIIKENEENDNYLNILTPNYTPVLYDKYLESKYVEHIHGEFDGDMPVITGSTYSDKVFCNRLSIIAAFMESREYLSFGDFDDSNEDDIKKARSIMKNFIEKTELTTMIQKLEKCDITIIFGLSSNNDDFLLESLYYKTKKIVVFWHTKTDKTQWEKKLNFFKFKFRDVEYSLEPSQNFYGYLNNLTKKINK